MVFKSKPKIVIINENLIDAPYIVDLEQIYGKGNLYVFQNANEGAKFIEAHIAQKMIVILDIVFGKKAQSFKIFEDIQHKTALNFIVIVENLEKLEKAQLVKLINGHSWHITKRDSKELLTTVKNIETDISTRVDGVLGEWIVRHSNTDREKPYLLTRSGQSYSLNQILQEIRLQTDFGKGMERNILNLTIDLLARQKEQLTD
jgi:hypothetical protein